MELIFTGDLKYPIVHMSMDFRDPRSKVKVKVTGNADSAIRKNPIIFFPI